MTTRSKKGKASEQAQEPAAQEQVPSKAPLQKRQAAEGGEPATAEPAAKRRRRGAGGEEVEEAGAAAEGSGAEAAAEEPEQPEAAAEKEEQEPGECWPSPVCGFMRNAIAGSDASAAAADAVMPCLLTPLPALFKCVPVPAAPAEEGGKEAGQGEQPGQGGEEQAGGREAGGEGTGPAPAAAAGGKKGEPGKEEGGMLEQGRITFLYR